MKKWILVLLFAWSPVFAQQVFRLEYETTISPSDLAGTVFNSELLATIRESELVNVGNKLRIPRLRVIVRTLPISEVSTRISVFDVTLLIDQEDGTSMYVGSWPGYAGDLSAKKFAKNIGIEIKDYVDKLGAELTKR